MAKTTDTFPPKSDMILRLEKEKKSIHLDVVKLIANKNKSEVKGKQWLKILESLNDKTLKEIYATFIFNKSDKTGKHFEYRCLNYYFTNFLKKKGKEAEGQLSNIDMHRTLIKKSKGNINFDFVIEYKDGQEIDLIECKDRKKEIDQDIVHDFLENCRGVDNAEHNSDVENIFLFSKNGFTRRALDAVKEIGGSKGHWAHDKALGFIEKDWMDIYLIAEKNDKLTQIYPSLR